jgi:hypothetical protein
VLCVGGKLVVLAFFVGHTTVSQLLLLRRMAEQFSVVTVAFIICSSTIMATLMDFSVIIIIIPNVKFTLSSQANGTTDSWKRQLYARLNRIRQSRGTCGDLCNINDTESFEKHT